MKSNELKHKEYIDQLIQNEDKSVLVRIMAKLMELQKEHTATKVAADYGSTYNDAIYFYIDAYIRRYKSVFEENQIDTSYDTTELNKAKDERLNLVEHQLIIHDVIYEGEEEVLREIPKIDGSVSYRSNTSTNILIMDYANESYFLERMGYCAEQAIFGSADCERTPHNILNLVRHLIVRT